MDLWPCWSFLSDPPRSKVVSGEKEAGFGSGPGYVRDRVPLWV